MRGLLGSARADPLALEPPRREAPFLARGTGYASHCTIAACSGMLRLPSPTLDAMEHSGTDR
eukprot:13839098-Alexandrium_andersonii.AAC.1